MIASALAGAALLLLAAHVLTAVLALAHMRRRPAGRIVAPDARIALVRPVTGADPFDPETLGSSFRQDWPSYEIVFCAPSDHDPAVAVVRRLMADNPDVRARLLTGQRPITGNPKLDNLWKGWEAVDADWVCMADSNLLLPPDYLRTLAATWERDTGLVSSPAWGDRPEGLAGHLECAFLNGNQARLQLAADALGQGFAQGKSLFWNRAMLVQAGGLAPLGRWLAEDVAATRLVRGRGLRVRLTPAPFAQPIGRKSFRAVWDRQLRWSRVRRDGFPAIFLAEIANGAVLPALLLAAAGWGAALPVFLIAWYGTEWALVRRAGWPSGPADVAAMGLRDLLLPAIWAATFLRRGISWRGHAMSAPARAGDAE